jgi:hypothetical protein
LTRAIIGRNGKQPKVLKCKTPDVETMNSERILYDRVHLGRSRSVEVNAYFPCYPKAEQIGRCWIVGWFRETCQLFFIT